MLRIITHSDSYVVKCDDIFQFVDYLVGHSGFYYYNDNLFIPFHEVVRVEKIKQKAVDVDVK